MNAVRVRVLVVAAGRYRAPSASWLDWMGCVGLGKAWDLGLYGGRVRQGSLRGWVRCWCVSSWLREFGLVCGHHERSLGQQTSQP